MEPPREQGQVLAVRPQHADGVGRNWLTGIPVDRRLVPRCHPPFVYTPEDGHEYTLKELDPSLPGCDGHPETLSCEVARQYFVGDAEGVEVHVTIS